MYPAVGLLFLVVAIAFLFRWASRTDIPKIKNLPELPEVPVFGNLLLLGQHHARSCAALAKRYGDVFQVRLGNRVSEARADHHFIITNDDFLKRFVYVNSFDSVRELWIKNQHALVSRPKFWTFHSVASKSQEQAIYTLGSSPWTDSLRRTRKAAATALNRTAVQTYLPFLDLESLSSMSEILDNARKERDNELDPNAYIQRFALSISLTLTFGIRLPRSDAQNNILAEVVEVERQLANIRGLAHSWQDYIPILRLNPRYRRNAVMWGKRRNEYVLGFYAQMQQRHAEGTLKPCIAGNVVNDPEAKLSDNELRSICLTMVAGGLDTLPGNTTMAIAYLSSPHGQLTQTQLHAAILETYAGEDPWHACLYEEKCELMVSFVKETLRYWSTFNLSFNRESISDIDYRGAIIPAGTPFIMNTYAANHDPTHFVSPSKFQPDRFMKSKEERFAAEGTQHWSYSAGPRMCAGVHLANREFYILFTRLILAFHILPAQNEKDRPILDPIDCNAVPTSMVTQPKPFKVKFVPRDQAKLDQRIQESETKTAHL